MSNTVIKDITRALQALLFSQITAISSTAQVSLLPPGAQFSTTGIGLNLYLYRVVESRFTKNQSWPGDKVTAAATVPALGLELSYLLTPFAPGPDPTTASGDDAHTMLGAAMMVLHENAVLNDIHIPGFDADVILPATVLNSFEQVKVRLAASSIEELSKIWATINQPYRLSVAYEVSVVELTPTPPPPPRPGIVLSTGLNVIQFHAPRIDTLFPSSGPLAAVGSGGTLVGGVLTINGAFFSFPGRTPLVQFGGQTVVLNTSPAPTDAALAVTLPITLDAGPAENVAVTLNSLVSTPLTFTVTPWLSGMTPIRSAVDATGGPPAPTLVLKGSGFTVTPQAVRLDGPSGTTNVTTFVGSVTDGQITITIPSTLANGIYQVRVVLAAPGNAVSNSRALEIIPLVSAVSMAVVTVTGNQVHQLTIQGARLNGADVRLLIDNILYQTVANANAAQLVFQLGRLLISGAHTVAVIINGSKSHDFTVTV